MFDPKLIREVKDVLDRCRDGGLRLATVESCTGGLLAAALTAVPGSSAVVERGYVTYSNEAKTTMVGVPATLIARDGAVSETVARAMAEGALARSPADIAVAITGIAGPDGGSNGKPVGLVYIGLSTPDVEIVSRNVWPHDRIGNKQATVDEALRLLMTHLTHP